MSEIYSPSFKTKPTILQVIPALGSGGVEIETIIIAKAIVKAGGRAIVVSGTHENTIKEKGIEFRTLPLKTKNPFQILKNATLLKKLIIDEKVDIVHARSRGPAWSAYKAARALNVPFVTTYHAAYASKSILKTFYNSVMAKGDLVIAISHFIQDHILEKYKNFSWFEASKIRLIERGIDLQIFDPHAVSKERLDFLKKTWNTPPKRRLILLPGRISKNKGQDILIKALSLMKEKDIHLIFVGSAEGKEDYRDFLLKYAASLNLADRVTWIPPAHDLPAAYQLADIVVCPSLAPEGFGRVVAEAQAMKKPVVVSAHGAAQEVIEEGITGWEAPPGNSHALAHVLDKIMTFPQKRLDEIGEKGRVRIKEKYDQKIMESKTISIYKELLGN